MPYKDKEKQASYLRRWMAKRRADFFYDKWCERCFATDNLELDHIDPKQKVEHRIWSWSAKRREEEIAKCQVLCYDCHLEKTKVDLRHDWCPAGHALMGDNLINRTDGKKQCKICHRIRMRNKRSGMRS